MGRLIARRALSLVLFAMMLGESSVADTGEVSGRVRLSVEGATLAELGPMVVYLDSAEGEFDFAVSEAAPRTVQKDAVFSPGFLVIVAGQTVEMPNDDLFFHNAFSYSRPNDFDLGLFGKGDPRSVTFRHPGTPASCASIARSTSR